MSVNQLLYYRSEVIQRKFTITKALLFKADRSSFDRLRQQVGHRVLYWTLAYGLDKKGTNVLMTPDIQARNGTKEIRGGCICL